jgi:hypothetical protein
VDRAHYLLATLLSLVAGAKLHPRTLDPWRGWVLFKQFARLVDEVPDPGVTVQITRAPAHGPVRLPGPVRLYYMRQLVDREDDGWLEPRGGVVCEFTFPRGIAPGRPEEFWSFDYPDFEHFVDAVEQDPAFTDLTVRRPLSSRIYWEDS